jgi:amino acid transporter
MMDQLLPIIYMIGVLLLVLPAFLQSNSKLKQFLTNLTVWIVVVLIILTIMYIFKNKYWLYEKAMLVIKTNTPHTSISPYRLPLAFTLFFYSERPSSNDY